MLTDKVIVVGRLHENKKSQNFNIGRNSKYLIHFLPQISGSTSYATEQWFLHYPYEQHFQG